MTLDYFYGQAGELFSFYRIPKALFQEPRFQSLSTDAKTLYGILLDRMSLSAKNGWLDEQGRVFIIFTIEDTLYQIVNLLVDTCATNRKTLRIAGDDKPAEVVRSRFMKLNADHICFVLKCLAENSSPIRNMKQYLLASLYNAPTTMQLSYQNQTNHDLANRR